MVYRALMIWMLDIVYFRFMRVKFHESQYTPNKNEDPKIFSGEQWWNLCGRREFICSQHLSKLCCNFVCAYNIICPSYCLAILLCLSPFVFAHSSSLKCFIPSISSVCQNVGGTFRNSHTLSIYLWASYTNHRKVFGHRTENKVKWRDKHPYKVQNSDKSSHKNFFNLLFGKYTSRTYHRENSAAPQHLSPEEPPSKNEQTRKICREASEMELTNIHRINVPNVPVLEKGEM